MNRTLVFVIILGSAGAFGLWKWGVAEESAHLPYADREVIVRARQQGKFDVALTRLASAASNWAGVEPTRVGQIDTHRLLIRNTREAFGILHTEYMARVLEETEREQVNKLKILRSKGSQAEREASVILMSGIRDFRMAAEAAVLAKQGRVPQPGEVGQTPAEAVPETSTMLPKPEWLDARIAEIRDCYEVKNYMQAIELAQASVPDVPAQHAGPLLDIMADVRRDARDEMHELVSKAYAMRKTGKLAAAVKMLQTEAVRFPGHGNLSYLYRELDQLSAELGVSSSGSPSSGVAVSPRKPSEPVASKRTPPAAPSGSTSSDSIKEPASNERPSGRLDKRLITRVLRDVEKAEKAGDLQAALTLLAESIENNSAYQPSLARHLGEIQSDLILIQALAAATTSVGPQFAGKSVKLRDGNRVQLVGIEGAKVHAKVDGQPREFAWLDLPLSLVEQLANAAKVDPETRLGIAALGYRQGNDKAAEASLVRLLGSNKTLFPQASKIISRGRGEYVDEQGYTIVGGKFFAVRFLKVQKLAKQMASKLSQLGRLTTEKRDEALEELRETGEDGLEDALVLALKDQLDALATKVGSSKLPKALAKMSATRTELDAARKHAKDLIYDTKAYFYPYKPPAVSGAKHSEYNKVQKEVNIRVSSVRKLWDDKVRIPVPALLSQQIELLLWTENQLGMMGEVSDGVLSHMDWIHTIPPVETISLRNFCATAEEKDDFVHYAKIHALNERLAPELNSGERGMVEVNNAYRVMFGHRPLAIDLRLHKAAHSHGEEMSRLGYFSHTSPTKERRTPFRRMKLVGYDAGASENLAISGSAVGSHNSWCHSSGHHRNLLNARHTEVGMGNYGKYWVQNFGGGRDYDK